MTGLEKGISYQNPKVLGPLCLCLWLYPTFGHPHDLKCHKGGSAGDSFDKRAEYLWAARLETWGIPMGIEPWISKRCHPAAGSCSHWRHGGTQDQHLVSNWVLGLSLSPGIGSMLMVAPGLKCGCLCYTCAWHLWQRGESGLLIQSQLP